MRYTVNRMRTVCDKLGSAKVAVLFEQYTVIKDGKLSNPNEK